MKSHARHGFGPALTLAALVSVLALAGACGSDGDRPAASDAGSPQEDCSASPKSQALSQPCCLAYGIDACGASLFCAAFDGRTQPTCYAERSRLDQTECDEDRQCASSSCNAELRKCRSSPGTACSGEVGCARDLQNKRYACDTFDDDTCKAVPENGQGGDVCEAASDCASSSCVDHRCLGKAGDDCRWMMSESSESQCTEVSDCGATMPENPPSFCSHCAAGDSACLPGSRCIYAVWSGSWSSSSAYYCGEGGSR